MRGFFYAFNFEFDESQHTATQSPNYEIIRTNQNSILRFEQFLEFSEQFFGLDCAVDVGEFAFCAIVRDERLGLFAVNFHSMHDRFGLVVIALVEFAAAFVANAFDFRRLRENVEIRSAFFADAARAQAIDYDIFVNHEIHANDIGAEFCKRVGLRNRPRESVENEAVFAVGFRQAFFDERTSDVVAHKSAAVDDGLYFFAKLSLIFNRGAENVARGNVGNLVVLRDFYCERAFSRSRRSEKNKIHFKLL